MTHSSSEQSLTRFLEIIDRLRDPNGGCPWDVKQTFQSLKPLIIEEAYEVADAVDSNERAVGEELGDLLSLIALFAHIGRGKELFSFDSVLNTISDKLVRRHPHVFGEVTVSSSEEVLQNWEQIKQQERASQGKAENKGLLDGIPKALPALLRAHQIGERCARVGFDWTSKEGVAEKVKEELGEFLDELAPDTSRPSESGGARRGVHEGGIDQRKVFEEFGDLLFTLAQYSRHLGFNAEEALSAANVKFAKRFSMLERLANERFGSKPLLELGKETLEQLWSEVK